MTILLLMGYGSIAQNFSASGVVGYASPKGETFQYDEGTGGAMGITYTADVLYYLPNFDDKLAVGLVYNGSLLAGGGQSGGFLNVDLYSLDLYGVKAQYRFFKSKVSPFVGVSTGLSKLTTPEVSINGDVAITEQNSFSLGLAPEFGITLGNFKLAAIFYTPMKYNTWDSEKKTAGALQFVLGYNFPISFN
jgi:hypothetical protein